MSIATREINTCDSCCERIPEDSVYVCAMVYGVTFHQNCWDNLKGPMLAKLLGLDDIKWRLENDTRADGGKVIYTDIPAFHAEARR